METLVKRAAAGAAMQVNWRDVVVIAIRIGLPSYLSGLHTGCAQGVHCVYASLIAHLIWISQAIEVIADCAKI